MKDEIQKQRLIVLNENKIILKQSEAI